jgi:exodeoxyribonuclease III
LKIATWNVNSIRIRLPRLVSWLKRRQPDIVCLQETKVVDEDFPLAEISEAGYNAVINGQKTYNGVAILSRSPIAEVRKSLSDDPTTEEKRLLAATIDGIRVINVYAPNGGALDSDKYTYKLDWYRRLRKMLDESFNPADDLVICGDFNVAPEDRDVWDPDQWRDQVLFSEPEKAALRELTEWGLIDSLRLHRQEAGIYTWWDYRAGAFHRGWGLRIDHLLMSSSLAKRCKEVEIDRNERKGEKPSDHAPVIALIE